MSTISADIMPAQPLLSEFSNRSALMNSTGMWFEHDQFKSGAQLKRFRRFPFVWEANLSQSTPPTLSSIYAICCAPQEMPAVDTKPEAAIPRPVRHRHGNVFQSSALHANIARGVFAHRPSYRVASIFCRFWAGSLTSGLLLRTTNFVFESLSCSLRDK